MTKRLDRPVFRVGTVTDEALLIAEPARLADEWTGKSAERSRAEEELRALFRPGMLVTITPLVIADADDTNDVGT